jgi:hypothetical protein
MEGRGRDLNRDRCHAEGPAIRVDGQTASIRLLDAR